jgi:hypothetical protein
MLYMFTIEKNVPIPEYISKVPVGGQKYRFDLMQEGDSFFVPSEDGEEAKETRRKLFNTSRRYARLYKMKFLVLAIEAGESQVAGARCWRVQSAHVQ